MGCKKRSPETIKKINRQVGRSNRRIDQDLPALWPGQRRSSSGKKYWETRRNRSDLADRI